MIHGSSQYFRVKAVLVTFSELSILDKKGLATPRHSAHPAQQYTALACLWHRYLHTYKKHSTVRVVVVG